MCLEDCGKDVHAHVVNCPENTSKNVFVSEAEFKEHHRKRREVAVNEKLKDLPAKTQNLLLERIGKDLEDLKIEVYAIQGADQVNNES